MYKIWICPWDPGSPKLRMVSWNQKWPMRFVSVIGHPFAHQLTNINDGCRLRDVYIYAWPPNGNPWIPAGPGQNFWLFKLFKNKRSWNNGRCLTNRSPPLAASNTNSNLATVAFLYIHILSNQWRCIHQIVMKICFQEHIPPGNFAELVKTCYKCL